MSAYGKVFSFLKRKGIFFFKKIWIFFAFLLIVQTGLLYISVSDIKIPAGIVKILIRQAESEGFRCAVGELRLSNLTVLSAKEIRVDTALGKEPLLRVRRASLKFAPNALFSQNKIPQLIALDGVALFCPSVNSATGRSEQIFSDGAFFVRRRRGVITIESAKCRVGAAEIVAYGKMPGTRQFFFGEKLELPFAVKSPEKDFSPQEKPSVLVSRFLGMLSDALRPSPIRTLLDSSTVVVALHPEKDAVLADISVLCSAVDIADRIHFKRVLGGQKIVISPARKQISPRGALRISAEKVEGLWGQHFSNKIWFGGECLSIAAKLPETVFSEKAQRDERFPKSVFFRAGQMRTTTLKNGTIHLENVLVSAAPQTHWDFPSAYVLKINAALEKSTLAVAGTVFADTENPSLDLRCDFLLNKEELSAFPQLSFIATQEDVKALRFTEQPRLRGSVRFAPKMKFERMSLELDSGELTCGDVHLRALRVAGEILPDVIRFPKIKAEGLDFLANADVFLGHSSGDFRIRAWGTINPAYLDGRLPWFWSRIWRDLKPAPSKVSPRADIDVHGNWACRWENVFGAIAGENCYGNGVLVEKVRLRVYENPLLIAAFDMGFERGDDLAEGTLQWHYAEEPTYHYRDFRFLFNGTFPPKDVLQIIGEGLPEVLSELRTTEPATAVVSGLFSGDPQYYPDKMVVNVKGSVPGEFSIFGIEGKDFNGEIFYDNGVVFVGNPFVARSGDGSVAGRIRVTLSEEEEGAEGAKVELALDLKNVQRSRIADVFSAVGNHIAESPSADAPQDQLSDEVSAPASADTSSIDAVFVGMLIVPDLYSLDGEGTFLLKENDLFELQVFGGISKLLSTVKVDLTTFSLNRAESSFVVRGGKIFLPDLRIFSESGEINIRANVGLPDFDIEGEAIFRNLRGTRIPLLGKIVEWGSSPTTLLPVKISGTPENLNWAFSGFWSSKESEKYGVAPEKGEAKSNPINSKNNEEN